MNKPVKKTASGSMLQRFFKRVRARRRVPRRWWYPLYPAPPAPSEPGDEATEEERKTWDRELERLTQAHEETSKTVRAPFTAPGP